MNAASIAPPIRPEEPIRSEIFGIDRLMEHAESLAAAQLSLTKPSGGRNLLGRVRNNGKVLVSGYRNIVEAVREKRVITPAEEWLLDNFHIVDEHLREIRDHLPGSYYRVLPKIAEGHLEGYPRVYGLAWAYVAHTDSRFDLETLEQFVRAYQRIQPLAIGELWAVAIFLRVALIENLRRLTEQTVHAREARAAADEVADRLLGLSGRKAEPVESVLGSLDGAPVSDAFSVQLVQRLRDEAQSILPAMAWLNRKLGAQGTSAREVVAKEHQVQAASNITVRNIITSMRWMSSIDWIEFFEDVSLIDEVLRSTPGFSALDFKTRDDYRKQVELLSRRSGRSEIEVAREAVRMARNTARENGSNGGPRTPEHLHIPQRAEDDPGYYLISRGRGDFEKHLGVSPSPGTRLRRAFRTHASSVYLGGIAAATLLLLAPPLALASGAGVNPGLLLILGLLAIVPASDIAVAMVHRFIPMLVPPKSLPKLELVGGVPSNFRTMVVVPTLLGSEADIEEQIERLEVHYLANPLGHVHFALLTDWTDAPREHMPRDKYLLDKLSRGIALLNKRYEGPSPGEDRFLLLHRRRLWNPREGKWMGWERKRGKLHELNRLLRGAGDTSFIPVKGKAPRVPRDVRYVITLDADTRIPKGVAYRLVGTMAHPLNRPRLDPDTGRVIEGYGILQPRITPSLPTGPGSTPYQRIVSGPGGVDPYAAAVSDVYQDLFQEGSFTGKGIYDVDAFEAALSGKVPENTLLSHDLFEGSFARAGLVTDVEFFEEFPTNYEVAARRQHRWVRGDWQLLPWIMRYARDREGNPVSLHSPARWKMVDNLRRSLSAPMAFLMVVASWVFPGVSPAFWTALFLGSVGVPAFIPFIDGLIPRRWGISKRSHLRAVGHDIMVALLQTLVAVAMLAHQAWIMADAIVRTIYRLYFSRRNLLEWVTAAQAGYGVDPNLPAFWRHLRGGMILAAVSGLLLLLVNPGAWPSAAPLVLLWILSPGLAWWLSIPPKVSEALVLSKQDTRAFRLIARRTWRFFETFVDEEQHGLPPDNFQEDPEPVTADRTSPTNIGMYLQSTVVANDFGWIGLLDTVERLEGTLETLAGLRRFRGHFFNWYDTRNLRPLEPIYVSTVDSGNLAGHLIALAQGCRDLMHRPLFGLEILEGVKDALQLVLDSLEEVQGPRRDRLVSAAQLRKTAEEMAAELEDTPASVLDWGRRLKRLGNQSEDLLDMARAYAGDTAGKSRAETASWAEAVRDAVQSHTRDLQTVLPWCVRLAAEDRTREDPSGAGGDGSYSSALELLVNMNVTPAGFPVLSRTAHEELKNLSSSQEIPGVGRLLEELEDSQTAATALENRLSALAQLSEQLVRTMDFEFLFDRTRKLFSIGYRVRDRSLDPGCYDLLASEARLASFLAIAKGDVSPSHWFLLGRSLTPVVRGAVLVSWSGSMFEYLMPLLVMRQPARSLLDLTCRLVVQRQMRYGEERRVPWGVSESAYNVRDIHLTYQYSDFGVPGLGLKRGLFEDVVVAPYATALAAMVNPKAALHNLGRLQAAGGLGAYGFYEALDYTPARLPEGANVAVVRAFMAHHQGMTLVSIGNVVHDGRTRNRFHAHPMIQAAELLLQERTPRAVAVTRPRGEEVRVAAFVRDSAPPTLRRFESPHDITPRTHLLSNGRYSVMITASGSGFSRCGNLAVTRWREDTTRDCWGTYFYLRDAETGDVWSAGFQPSGTEMDFYDVFYSEDRAKIQQGDRSLSITLEIVVSPEDDAELRKLTVTNMENHDREIDITSYAEIVLAPQAADEAHPAFSNLFVETEFVPELKTLLATRRPRSAEEAPIWLAHLAAVEGETTGQIQYESDRSRFLGRGRGVRTPISVIDGGSLSNTSGGVLDPIVSLRHRVKIPQGGKISLVFSTLITASRAEALELAEKYRQTTTFERESSLAWTKAQVQLQHLRITPDDAHLFQRLGNRLLYADPTLRAAPQILARNRRGAEGLWSYGISGDLPIILVTIEREEERSVVRQLLRAHEYWNLKGISADLVILNSKGTSYAMELQDSLESMVRASQAEAGHEDEMHGSHGNVYLLRSDLVPLKDRTLLWAAARVTILARRGTLSEQVVRLQRQRPGPVPPTPGGSGEPGRKGSEPAPAMELEFFNGLGGFASDGREYVTVLEDGQWTPAPWINVISNPQFGFQVSEMGSGYTWSMNSRENKLTPWSNDPVSDPPGEVFYVRDLDSGRVWGPTPLPIRGDRPYTVRHGQGYTRFEHVANGIALDLLQMVPLRDPVKISRLSLENRSRGNRRLSVSAYAEWVLGTDRGRTAAFVVTSVDPKTGCIMARNAWSGEFAGRVAFADLGGQQTSWTGDRTEFLGRNASLEHPASVERGDELSGKVGAGLDPCAVLQTEVELEPGERKEVVFLLGQGGSREQVRSLIEFYRKADCDTVFQEVREHWSQVLETIQVKTPDRSMDLLLNRWLLYQTLSCRIWSRSAFYQSGGAYGFRDQLQDVLALTVPRPDIVREHILRAAARQFPEGDVQHWWHPPSGRGVRTQISDDRLWLPYAVVRYIQATGDRTVLEENVPWIEGPGLEEKQPEAYFEPRESTDSSTVYEHCARALERSLPVGSHGLPLMGSGDWNDGMNRVGHEGRGESVWLGWFLLLNLKEFAEIAELRGEGDRAARWREKQESIRASLEAEAWDGRWYRRAFFDDGSPLGSEENEECRIDSIAQSWAVLSGAGDPERARLAMKSVEQMLVRSADRLVQLFHPPFDKTPRDPGYIKGYLPGVRENGGQYTHAAIWSVVAFAMLNEGRKSVDLFGLLNPINHAGNRAGMSRYKVEPYVVAADVYSAPVHTGRGGWTWYTGAASWLYRAGLEWILGFRKQGSTLRIDPSIPKNWTGFEIGYRHGETRYRITVENPRGVDRGVSRILLDGSPVEEGAGVPLLDDGGEHHVRVVMG